MKKVIVFCLVVGLGITGCSTRLAYNNLDWLIRWYASDFVSLNTPQKQRFVEQIDTLLTWHRQYELPQYHAQLLQLNTHLETGTLTADVIAEHAEITWQHWLRLRAQLAPPLAEMAYTLDEQQIEDFFAAVDKKNKEMYKRLHKQQKMSPSAQKRDREKELRKTLKKRIGQLTPAQESIIAEYSAEIVSSMELWMAYRARLQVEARSIFAERDEKDVFITRMIALIDEPERFQPPELRTLRQDNQTRYLNFLTAFSESLTAKQKQKLISEIQDIISDIEGIMEST